MLIILSLWLGQISAQVPVFNVKEYGATGTKSALCTESIQAAIDAAFEQGGGRVYLPPGQYLSGTLILKDNVTLYLEAGAVLYPSHDINDYRLPLEKVFFPVFLYAKDAKNIALGGKGTIDGEAIREYRDLEGVDKFIAAETENARAAGVEMKMYYRVPPNTIMVQFTDCQDVTVTDITLRESTFWNLHFYGCTRVDVRGVHIYSSLEKGVNSDGIDINSCHDVTVTDCIVETGDDAIVVKTWYHRKQDCSNVTVTNCVLSSSSTALKIGTETWGDIRNVVFSNCVVKNSNRGLSIVVRDGGTVENVLFSNIIVECNRRHFNWWGNGDPIWVYMDKRRPNRKAGRISHVRFENIIAHGRGTSKVESLLEEKIKDVSLRNVQFFMHPEDYADKRADDAFYASQVEGLSLENVSVVWDTVTPEPKWRNALNFSAVNHLRVRNFEGSAGQTDPKLPVIEMHEVRDARFNDCNAAKATDTFINLTGESTADVLLQNVGPEKGIKVAAGLEGKVEF